MKWNKKLFVGFAGGASLLAMTVTAQAATFGGNVVGSFSTSDTLPQYAWIDNNDANANAIGYLSAAEGGGGLAEFSWGYTTTSLRESRRQDPSRNDRSYFAFQGVGSDTGAPPAFSIEDGQSFSLGTFTYRNTPVYGAEGVDGIDFGINITVTIPNISETFTIGLGIINTPNDAPDPRDYAQVTSVDGSMLFNYNGADYELQLLGFCLNGEIAYETYADEYETVTADIYAQFNQVSAVPVPGAAWLLGSGILGLLPMARRKK